MTAIWSTVLTKQAVFERFLASSTFFRWKNKIACYRPGIGTWWGLSSTLERPSFCWELLIQSVNFWLHGSLLSMREIIWRPRQDILHAKDFSWCHRLCIIKHHILYRFFRVAYHIAPACCCEIASFYFAENTGCQCFERFVMVLVPISSAIFTSMATLITATDSFNSATFRHQHNSMVVSKHLARLAHIRTTGFLHFWCSIWSNLECLPSANEG